MAHPDRALLGRSRGGGRRARRRNFACPSFRLKERCKLADIGTGTHETEPITENFKVTGVSMKCRNLLVVFLGTCGVFLSVRSVVQAQNAVSRSMLCETGCL